MEKDQKLEELTVQLERARAELEASAGSEYTAALLDEIRELRSAIQKRERELYYSLETPEPLVDLAALSLFDLKVLEEGLVKQIYAIADPTDAATEEGGNQARMDRIRALREQRDQLRAEIDRLQELSYAPGPGDPPGYEPQGYSASPSFVKSNPSNNDYYVEQYRDHPWYPAISSAHEQLKALIPGYNIVQIKNKFGGLCYYFSFPDPIPVRDDAPAYSTPEKIRAIADSIITRAEGWVDGYSYAQQQQQAKLNDTKE